MGKNKGIQNFKSNEAMNMCNSIPDSAVDGDANDGGSNDDDQCDDDDRRW